MKIPYIKLYTADLLASSRYLTTDQIGSAILGICEQAFENDTSYLPDNTREESFYAMLTRWKDEAKTNYTKKKKSNKKAAAVRWQKNPISEDASCIRISCATVACQTETETKTDTETDTETENIKTTQKAALKAQGECAPVAAQPAEQLSPEIATHKLLELPLLGDRPLPPKEANLEAFARRVAGYFEPNVKTVIQRWIWFKRNRRCLNDILNFCEGNVPLALQTIDVCLERLEQAGLEGGYEAVLRHIPDYCAKAREKMEHSPYVC